MRTKDALLLAFYGDDFTGSTDALEFLSQAGIKTVLFMAPPAPAQLQRYPGLRAFGVAGTTRSMPPAEMEAVLRPALASLRASGAPHVHYKVCSTFDSSPGVGSIGKAIEVGAEIFKAPFVPLLVAAPALGRYCAFGNLFARLGIGSAGSIYRLDRHPSMSRHPVTPADESDLRLHLARQTAKSCGLLDLLQVGLPLAEAREHVDRQVREGAEIVLIDAVYPTQMAGIGALLDAYANPEQPLFSVGSSGIEMALGAHWVAHDVVSPEQGWPLPGKAAPMLVISGSCSPVTSVQIGWALRNGFAGVALDTGIFENDGVAHANYVAEAVSHMRSGRSVIVHTSLGTGDPRMGRTARLLAEKGISPSATARVYGTALGRIARDVAVQAPYRRLVVAGGDTSGFAGLALGIEAVEMIAALVPGAPLCRALAPGSPADGLEINFKGGQVGGEDYFGLLLEGRVNV